MPCFAHIPPLRFEASFKITVLLTGRSLTLVDDDRLDIQERSTIHCLDKYLFDYLSVFLKASSMMRKDCSVTVTIVGILSIVDEFLA